MSEFHEGDTIEAVKGKRRITDVAVNGNLPWFSGLHLGEPSVIGLSSIDSYIRAGYTLTVIEKAAPKLPSEPGSYVDRQGAGWTITPNGDWRSGYKYTDAREAIGFAPFTRVERESVTAKKVLDAIRDDIVPGTMTYATYGHVTACITHVGEQFGVSQ